MAYANGVVSVGTSATLICLPGPEGVLVQNLGATVVFLGGAGVTADTAATGGIQLPATMTTPTLIRTGTEPGTVGDNNALYGRVASGSVNIAFLTVA